MKKLLFSMFALGFSMLIYQCEQAEENDVIPKTLDIERNTYLLLPKKVTVDNAGKIHNQMVIEFFAHMAKEEKSKEITGRTLSSYTESDVLEYFDNTYGVALSESSHYVYNSPVFANARTTSNLASSFNPYNVLETFKDSVSEYMHQKSVDLFKATEIDGADPRHIMTVIHSFRKGIKQDKNFSRSEAEDFLLALDVYESSVNLWVNLGVFPAVVEAARINSCGITKSNAWGIPAADMTSGLFGGLVGGPAGALAGLASGSIVHVIGVYAGSGCYTIPVDGLSKKSLLELEPISPYKDLTYYQY
jgi:hypothetical protein